MAIITRQLNGLQIADDEYRMKLRSNTAKKAEVKQEVSDEEESKPQQAEIQKKQRPKVPNPKSHSMNLRKRRQK